MLHEQQAKFFAYFIKNIASYASKLDEIISDGSELKKFESDTTDNLKRE